MISHWVLVDPELRPLAVKIQCVALATKIREIIPRWDFENEQGQRLHADLLPLLGQINQQGRLTAAAKETGLSYRHAWNLLNDSKVFFGNALVALEKGRGAQLTPLGRKLLWSNQRIEARLHPEAESFATALNVELQGMLDDEIPVVRIFASHGYAKARYREPQSVNKYDSGSIIC